MKAARIVVTVALVLWWLPALLLEIAVLIGGELQAHVRIARASRMFAQAERLADVDRLDEAEALIACGEKLIELAKPKPRGPR